MRTLAIVALVIAILVFCGPLLLSAGRKMAAKAREVWREEEKTDVVKLVPKKDEDKPK